MYQAFRKLRPGVPLRALHGGMKQGKRLGSFQEFCAARAAVMISTDVAARGLDFPAVDWVVQADCPEDVAAYIHRCGAARRGARRGGQGRGCPGVCKRAAQRTWMPISTGGAARGGAGGGGCCVGAGRSTLPRCALHAFGSPSSPLNTHSHATPSPSQRRPYRALPQRRPRAAAAVPL